MQALHSRALCHLHLPCMPQGAPVLFFPEGTRSKDCVMMGFKKGAFSVAVKAGVDVVPITLLGTGKMALATKGALLGWQSRVRTGQPSQSAEQTTSRIRSKPVLLLRMVDGPASTNAARHKSVSIIY